MVNLYDIAYGAAVVAAAPYWLIAPKARRKVAAAFRHRLGRDIPELSPGGTVVWVHAVSVGEVNATPALVKTLLDARAGLRIVVSTTTETGHARGGQLFGGNGRVTLIRFPLDFSSAIDRALTRLRPAAVALMELEVWPNLVARCHERGIPVLVVNGRLTEYSFNGYRRLKPLIAPTFARLSAVGAQDETFAARFIALGTPPERVRVTGTMKFDTAQVADTIDGADALAAAVALRPDAEPIFVAGSTGPGEEQILLTVYRALLQRHPTLRLVIVPRHPPRFDEVAGLIEREGFPLLRRSRPAGGTGIGDPLAAPMPSTPRDPGNALISNELPRPVVLGDTMGELRKFYALATVVFVGRTLIDLGPRQRGSDMIEPAALGRPTIVGPWTQNFADAMSHFRAVDAIRVVTGAAQLESAVGDALADPATAATLGRRARDTVRSQQGATARHAEMILSSLANPAAH